MLNDYQVENINNVKAINNELPKDAEKRLRQEQKQGSVDLMKGHTMNIDIEGKLEKRHILKSAQEIGVIKGKVKKYHFGWLMPIFDIDTGEIVGYQFKNSSKEGPKYLPVGADKKTVGKARHPHADWVVPPDAKESINQTDGVCYLVNGYPALLAMRAAGIKNVICTTAGEGTVPQNTVEVLQKLSINRLLLIADNDETGEKSPVKFRDVIRGTGIDFEAYLCRWDAETPKKADPNDLWITVAGDTAVFSEKLASLPLLELPLPEVSVSNNFDDHDFDKTPEGLIQAIASAAGVKYWKSNGWSNNFSSPFREDKNPSAGMQRDSGVVNDFGEAGKKEYGPKQVAEAYGIDWRSYYPKPTKKKNPARPANMQKRLDSPEGEKPMAEWAKDIKPHPYSADVKVTLPYISDLDSNHHEYKTMLVKSPLGTGKTELFKILIASLEHRLGRKITVLVLTHQVALADQLAARLSIESYRNVPPDTGRQYIDMMNQLVCSFDSIHLVAGRQFDIVLIDEFMQFIPHVQSGTMKGSEASRNYSVLKDLVETAGQFVAADAHMNDFAHKWLKGHRGTITAIENNYRPNRGDLWFHRDSSHVLELAFAKIQENVGPVIIMSNSRKATDLYREIGLQSGLNSHEIMHVTGWNSGSAESQNFINNINQELPKYRLLICSPTFATGLDIQAYVAGVYAFFTQNNWGSASTNLQQLMRPRNAAERHVYVPPVFDGAEESDAAQIYSRRWHRLVETSDVAEFEINGISIEDPSQKGILRVQSEIQAQRAQERNEIFSWTVSRAKDEGFTPQYDETNASNMRQRLKEARAKLREEEALLTQTLEAMDPETFNELRKQGLVGREEHCQLNRFNIEYTAGQAINPELYEMLKTSGKRAGFNRLVDLLEEDEVLKKRDRKQALDGDLISNRRHVLKYKRLTNEALIRVFGKDYWNNREELTEDEINERLQAFIDSHKEDISLFDIDRNSRKGLSFDPLNVLRRLMGELKLSYKRVRDGEERHYVYFIDAEYSAKLYQLILIARDARHQREQEEFCPKTVYGTESNTILGQSNADNYLADDKTAQDAYTAWKESIRIPI